MTGQAKRAATAALGIAAALLVVLAASRCTGGSADEAAAPEAENGARQETTGFSADDPAEYLFERAGGAQVRWGRLPEGFESEVFDPQSLGAVDTACTDGCAGAVFPGERDQVAARVQDALERNGWVHAVEGAGDAEGLYHRTGGTYAWAFLQCQESAGSVCVTVALWGEDMR